MIVLRNHQKRAVDNIISAIRDGSGSNITEDLTTKDMISNFVANTVANPKFQHADMTVFTTAKGLNKKISDIMYHNRVRTFGYEELSKLLDNNDAFWDRYRSEIGI